MNNRTKRKLKQIFSIAVSGIAFFTLLIASTKKQDNNYSTHEQESIVFNIDFEAENGTILNNKKNYILNEMATFTALPNTGYQFYGWFINNQFVGAEKNFYYRIRSNIKVKAIFLSADLVYQFIENNEIIEILPALFGQAPFDVIKRNPNYIYGKIQKGWKTPVIIENKIAQVEANYIIDSSKDVIINIDGDESCHHYGDIVTAVAKNKNFSHWENIDGTLISYEKNYQFNANGNIYLKSSTIAPAKKIPTIIQDNCDYTLQTLTCAYTIGGIVFKNGTNSEQYGIVEAGLALSENTDINLITAIRYEAKKVNSSGQFVIRRNNIPENFNIYATGYVIYIDTTQKEVNVLIQSKVHTPIEPTNNELSIHHINLLNSSGNGQNGDCIYLKYGNIDILIDAGGSSSVATASIIPYLNNYIIDGKIDYLITTHGDLDHISSLIGPSGTGTTTVEKYNQGVLAKFNFGTIISYNYTHDSESARQYMELVADKVSKGANYCTSAAAYNNESETCKRNYVFNEEFSFEILYNKYYFTPHSNENNNSVITLFKLGNLKFIFAGDAEALAESSIVSDNTIGHVNLYKASHHGSNTGSGAAFLAAITPDIVTIPCDNTNRTSTYNFPNQDALNRIHLYTDQVYATFLNGHIVVRAKDNMITVKGSINDTLLRYTAWFIENRTYPDK